MDRAVAVVRESDADRRLLSEAGTLAAGVGAELVVLNVIEAGEYENEVQRHAGQNREARSLEEVAEEAKHIADRVASDALRDVDVEYETVGIVGDLPEDVLTEAEERDCDHVFIVGRRRSPTGKVLFGDVAQSVVLGFNGPVTVLVDRD